MAVVLGIDVGTSSMKAMLLDTEKGVAAVHAKSYEVDIPRPGYAQQDPERKFWTGCTYTIGKNMRRFLR